MRSTAAVDRFAVDCHRSNAKQFQSNGDCGILTPAIEAPSREHTHAIAILPHDEPVVRNGGPQPQGLPSRCASTFQQDRTVGKTHSMRPYEGVQREVRASATGMRNPRATAAAKTMVIFLISIGHSSAGGHVSAGSTD